MGSNNRVFVSVISLIMIVAGVILMIVPIAAVGTIAFIFGIVLAVYGALRVLQFIFTRHNDLHITLSSLLAGVLTAVLGVVLILNPSIANVLLEKLLAGWIILMGFIRLIIVYTYKRSKEKKWIQYVFRLRYQLCAFIRGAAGQNRCSKISRLWRRGYAGVGLCVIRT